MFGRVLSGVTVLCGVSNDILEHLYDEFPRLRNYGPQQLVISNGINRADFDVQPAGSVNLREQLRVETSVFLFGFFGRFMPEKGFDMIIEAVDTISNQLPDAAFAVVAVGSGDYLGAYKATIKKKGLVSYFYFLPFLPMVHHLYPQIDAVVMPSRWEASGLLAMESLCMGTPLIASNCIGLRETTADTPTFTFAFGNREQLVETMRGCLQDNKYAVFKKYIPEARQRFDVKHSAKQLVEFIDQLLERK
jgi:glycosyltransferase involved in cell wall biosynthesis